MDGATHVPVRAVQTSTPVYVISVAAAAVRAAPADPAPVRPARPGLARTAPPGAAAATRPATSCMLREVQRLSQDEGINLAGIKRILELENEACACARRSTACAPRWRWSER